MRTLLALMVTCLIAGNLAAQDMPLSDVLVDGQNWELVAEGYQFTDGPAVDPEGNVFFTDVPGQKILKIDHATGKISTFSEGEGGTSGLMFGPDGRLYGSQYFNRRIVVFDKAGKAKTIAEYLGANDLVVSSNGNIYCTDTPGHQVWLVRPSGEKEVVAKGIAAPNGIILWPNEGTLVVADSAGKNLMAFRVEEDGTLSYGAPVYTCRVRAKDAPSKVDGMTVDSAGRLYVATDLGIQMFDSTARISGVIHKPTEAFLTNITLGGPQMDTFYATCGGGIYRRTTQASGVRYGKVEDK